MRLTSRVCSWPCDLATTTSSPSSPSTSCTGTAWISGPLPLSQRKDLLATLLRRSKVDCLHLVATFPDGAKLLASAERLELEGIVSKRRAAPYRSGESNDWRKVKTVAWREANRERWRMFERALADQSHERSSRMIRRRFFRPSAWPIAHASALRVPG